MGILYQAIKIPNAFTLTFFINIFTHAKFIFFNALTRIGLYKPPPEESTYTRDITGNYMLLVDGSCPSLVPIPFNVVMSVIKNILPVFQYHEYLKLQEEKVQKSEIVEEEYESGCTICLEKIELEEEVRDLCNCGHLFHKGCLDTWIDEGQVTCPLCRSMLLSPKTILRNRFCKFQNQDLHSSVVVA